MKVYLQAGLIAITAMSVLAGGCGNYPRVVVSMDGRVDRMKLLYQEGSSFGVIRCHVGVDGALSDCQNLPVNLHE